MADDDRRRDLGFDHDAVIVTGAARGIGKATALLAAECGLDVAVWDLDLPGAEAVAQEVRAFGQRAVACEADVTDPAAIDAAVAASRDALGPCRYLVNNAGPPSTAELDFDDGVARVLGAVRAVTTAWLAQAPADAAVVSVASIAGVAIATESEWYTAAKAGIAGHTKFLADKRRGRLRANAVAPGLVHTERMAASGFADSELGRAMIARIPVGRGGTPEEIAGAICFLLSPLAGFVNGTTLMVDGGTTVAQ